MAYTGEWLDLNRLSVVGGAAKYYASIDGTAVPARCANAGIEFPDGIGVIAGQRLTLAAR